MMTFENKTYHEIQRTNCANMKKKELHETKEDISEKKEIHGTQVDKFERKKIRKTKVDKSEKRKYVKPKWIKHNIMTSDYAENVIKSQINQICFLTPHKTNHETQN